MKDRKVFHIIRILSFSLALFFVVGRSLAADPITREDIRKGLAKGGEARRRAVWYIYQMKENDLLLDAVPYMLKSRDPEDHRAILNVLLSYGNSLENYLPDWYVYIDNYINDDVPDDILLQCIALSEKWKEHRLMPALSRLATHPDIQIRLASFRAMASMGDDTLIPVLLRLINSKVAVERVYGLEGTRYFRDSRLAPFIQKTLTDENKSVRISALQAFVSNPIEAAEVNSLVFYFSKDEDPEVRAAILDIFAAQKVRSKIYVLNKGLEDPSPLVRLAALRAIQSVDETRSAFSISQLLQDENNLEVKRRAVETMLDLAQSGGGQGLSFIIMNETDRTLRLRAIMAAERSRARDTVSALIFSMKNDPSEEIRMEAANALGVIGDPTSSADLMEVLERKEDSYNVRSAVLASLLKVRPDRNLKELASSMNDHRDTTLRMILEYRMDHTSTGRSIP